MMEVFKPKNHFDVCGIARDAIPQSHACKYYNDMSKGLYYCPYIPDISLTMSIENDLIGTEIFNTKIYKDNNENE